MKNEKKKIEFSDEAILNMASKKRICLIDLYNRFPDINKTRIAHRMKSLRTSKHLVKATAKWVNYYRARDSCLSERKPPHRHGLKRTVNPCHEEVSSLDSSPTPSVGVPERSQVRRLTKR